MDRLYVLQKYVGRRPYGPVSHGCRRAFVLYLFVITESNFGNESPLAGEPRRHFARLRKRFPARNTMCKAVFLWIARQRLPFRDVRKEIVWRRRSFLYRVIQRFHAVSPFARN